MPDLEAAPERIGPYSILERLGRGGMGVVYRARHDATGQVLALKTVRVHRSNLLSGIRREVHALARLSHPGIVRILDEGVQDGVPWYAMELVEGITLRRALSGSEAVKASGPKGPREPWWTRTLEDTTVPRTQSLAEARRDAPFGSGPAPASRVERQRVLDAVRRVCGPLAFLHGEGIVHRDLKPDNVLLRPAAGGPGVPPGSIGPGTHPGDVGTPVLVDFGLAARFGGEISRDALEVDGWSGGTLAFMAPEQLRGEMADARADLYALGCILYWALTGQMPFRTLEEMEALGSEARRPSELAPGIAPELDALVLGLLRKRPRERLGYADAVAAALEALGATDGPGPPGPPARAYLYRAELAGRGELVDALGRHVSVGLQTGHGGLVLVGGESGIGKTRLALELAQRVRLRGFGVLAGECRPRGGPLHPLHGLFEHVADRCRERGVEETRRLLGPAGKVLALYEPALGTLPGLEQSPEPAELAPQEARARLYAALSGLLAALTARQPALLLLDDLQWADDLTLGWLEDWLQSASRRAQQGAPLQIVGTYRTEEAPETILRLLEMTQARSLRLERLEETAIGSMIGDMLALSPPPALFARFLTQRSGGSPFFVAEYLRTAVEEGLLHRDRSGLWQVADGEEPGAQLRYENLPLPGSVRDLVGRRLGGLSAKGQALAELAAVFGREVQSDLLADMAGMPQETLWEAVQELLARQVLEEPEPATGRLRFLHDQIREAAYGRIAEEPRRELHRRAAGALESRSAEDRSRTPGILAALGHHWEQARVPEKAREAYQAGARAAHERHAQGEAEQLYRACLRLCEPLSLQRAEAHRELGFVVLRTLGRTTEAIEELGLAVRTAREAGDSQTECQSVLNLGSILREVGRMDEARRLGLQALDLARGLGDRARQAAVLAHLGMTAGEQGRMDEARALQREALGLYKAIGDRSHEGSVLGYLGNLAREQGRSEEAEALYREALDLHREVGYRRGEGITLGNLGNVFLDLGQIDEARAAYEAALAIHREIGTRRFEGIYLGNLGMLLMDQGDLEGAAGLYEQALAIHRDVRNRRFEAMTLSNLATLKQRQARLDQADAFFEQALDLQRQVGDRRTEGATLSNLIALRIRQGRLEEARTLGEQALDLHREIGDGHYESQTLTNLAGLERLSGHFEEAARFLEQVEAVLRRIGGRQVSLACQCVCERGHLALAQGRPGKPFLEQAGQMTAGLRLGPRSDLALAIDKLARALAAQDSGHPLLHGECPEDLPRQA